MGKASRLRQERAELRKQMAGLHYYHGGKPGLDLGDAIVARGHLSDWNNTLVGYQGGKASVANRVEEGSFMYATTDLGVARKYASDYKDPGGPGGGGDVYRVALEGVPKSDPDYERIVGVDVFARARRAIILEVIERDVQMTEEDRNRAIGRYRAWIDGTPIYDADGFMNPSPKMRESGVSAAGLRRLGQWAPIEAVDAKGRIIDPDWRLRS